MQITGTYSKGKMYRGNGRWAKVLETKMVSRPSLISVAFGECEHVCGVEVAVSPAKSAYSYESKKGYRKSLDGSARHYIETGEIDV